MDISRLNLQAHASAQNQSDEYVLESILTFGLLPHLVSDLLAVEAWRTHVLPLLLPDLASNGNSMRAYFTLYHEATLVNLLEVLLYHKHVVQSLGDKALELVDYCARRMASLSVPVGSNPSVARAKKFRTAAEECADITAKDKVQEIKDHALDLEYKAAVASVAIARYLTEHFEALPLSAQSRILEVHDFLVLVVPLVEEPPWTRRRSDNGGWQKLSDGQNGKWDDVEPGELLKLTKTEAQVWLAVYHLTCTRACRESYALNAFRKEQLLRLRKYLNDVVLDQLPVLADVMRYMDELALMNVPEASSGHGGALLMQQVDVTRDKMLRGRDWAAVAKATFKDVWAKVTDRSDPDLRAITDVYSADGVESVFGSGTPFERTSLPVTLVSVDLFSGGGTSGASLLLCGRRFRVKDGSAGAPVPGLPGGPDFVRLKLSPSDGEGDEEKGGAALGSGVLPTDARVVVKVAFEGEGGGGAPFSVVVELGDCAFEGGEGAPAKCWKQVGSLAEKIVLQLSFERAQDEETGEWGYRLGNNAFVSQPVWEQTE